MASDLHTSFRPDSFELMLGNPTVMKTLQGFADDKAFPHSIMFSGGSGLGKTTAGRIVAKELQCSGPSLIEIDAATHTGVDAMRSVTEGLIYRGFGSNPIKVVIIDECQRLSKQSWESLLKILEEPPEHVYFILCTTDPHKVPKTIQTRCTIFDLQDVSQDELTDLLDYVAEEENIKLPKQATATIAQEAYGSPRKALTLLSRCRACTTIDEVQEALQAPGEDGDIIDFCRFLVNAGDPNWKEIARQINNIKDFEPESVRMTVNAYFTKVLLGNKVSEHSLERGLSILDAFSKPFYDNTKVAPIILATASVFFGE